MEHFRNPFDDGELAGVAVAQNQAFFDGLSQRVKTHRFFSHPFLSMLDGAVPPVACAVLASAESTIPTSFPILSALAQKAFKDVDTTFFDRHGARDEGHAGDASLLFAVSGQGAYFAAAEAEVMLDLDHRSELNDEWLARFSAKAC